MRRYAAPGGGVPGGRRVRRRERGRSHRVQPRAPGAGPRRSRCARCPAVSAGGSSCPASCSRRRGRTRPCCWTSRPTTSTPTRSSGCATTCRRTRADWWSSATTSACSSSTVTRVFHLDANRAELDVYNVGWKAYLLQRETDERRRKRERANVEKQASVLKAQADRMRYKATKARAAQSMDKRAAQAASAGWRRSGAATRSPSCGSRTPRRAARRRSPRRGCRSRTARSRSSPTSTWRSTGAAAS